MTMKTMRPLPATPRTARHLQALAARQLPRLKQGQLGAVVSQRQPAVPPRNVVLEDEGTMPARAHHKGEPAHLCIPDEEAAAGVRCLLVEERLCQLGLHGKVSSG